jgi:hypothetical protein
LIVNIAVVAPEIEPPFVRFTTFSRHWYVSGGAPDAVTEKPALAPAQTVWLDGEGAETVRGTRSCEPMSTMGGVPAPVFAAAGSS